MDIFLAGIIQGSIPEMAIHSQDWRKPLIALLARHAPQAKVYDHFAHHPNGIDYDLPRIRATLTQGNSRAAGSDVVFCWLPQASMGTSLEMYLAQQAGALVISITPMTTNWVIRAYSDHIFAGLDELEAFMTGGGLQRAVERKRGEG